MTILFFINDLFFISYAINIVHEGWVYKLKYSNCLDFIYVIKFFLAWNTIVYIFKVFGYFNIRNEQKWTFKRIILVLTYFFTEIKIMNRNRKDFILTFSKKYNIPWSCQILIVIIYCNKILLLWNNIYIKITKCN